MILEGVVTTMNPDGSLNVAPMGPRVEPDGSLNQFILRPFRSSTTYANLMATGEGVFHVTDDVDLIARAAIGHLDPQPASCTADIVQGRILLGACRYSEFRVVDRDEREDRSSLRAVSVASGRFRDFFGFNRAKHAVIEAAILATRMGIVPHDQILNELDRLLILVEKTGGPQERAAYRLIVEHVHAWPGVDRPHEISLAK